MLGLAGIPSLIQFFTMIFLPESPRWLMKYSKDEKARVILTKIYSSNSSGQECLEKEIEMIKIFIATEDIGISIKQQLKELFYIYRKTILIGVMLQVWQQLCGINTAMYYGPQMMKQAGFYSSTDKEQTLLWSLPLSGINWFGTFLALFFIDSCGRR
eukprot:TRINITY_DN16750_c0_g1_i2.p2 TRINITY_DN16750_c0_g1~~TRINITY_DN16750_c0_g1_i2.p2  ORF type:complete len:157 (-),score=12.68 TRINITY_DN16750_c0_g1_i2:543-1013(-)